MSTIRNGQISLFCHFIKIKREAASEGPAVYHEFTTLYSPCLSFIMFRVYFSFPPLSAWGYHFESKLGVAYQSDRLFVSYQLYVNQFKRHTIQPNTHSKNSISTTK